MMKSIQLSKEMHKELTILKLLNNFKTYDALIRWLVERGKRC